MSLFKRFDNPDSVPSNSGYPEPEPPRSVNEAPRGPLAERMNQGGGAMYPQGGNGYGGANGGASFQRQEVAQAPVRSPLTGQSNLSTARENNFYELKRKVQTALIAELDPKLDLSQTGQVRRTIEELFNRVLEQQGIVLNRQERIKLFEAIAAEILGFGPIEPLLNDDSISEVMVNGPHHVYVEQQGRLYKTDIRFRDDDHVMRVIDRIISPLGRRCDESQPYVDARLPDGSRVNAIIPPLSLVGPVITIRKFSRKPLTPDDLVRLGSMSQPMAEFLRACVAVRLNVIVSGGTGSGKTTLLNVLSSFIPGDERIVTIEDAAELQLRQEHVISLESRPSNIEGKGRISIRDLVANSLRMRPDRIIVGECRGGEALDMLQAMNTGHDGRLTAEARVHLTDGTHRVGEYVDELLTRYPERVEVRDQHGTTVEYIMIPRERAAFATCVTVDGKTLSTPVVYALRSRYRGTMLRIRTVAGHEHTVSPEHPLYALRDAVAYLPAGQVQAGDWLAAPRHLHHDTTATTADEETSYRAGLLGGEGALTDQRAARVHRSSAPVARDEGPQRRYAFGAAGMAVAERETRPAEALSPRHFVAGLFDADGQITLAALVIRGAHRQRLTLAREALLVEGIPCELRQIAANRSDEPTWELRITERCAIQRFAERVPLRGARTRADLRALCERLDGAITPPHADAVPCTARLARYLGEAARRGHSQRTIAARAGCSQALISAYRRGVRMPTPERLEQVCLALGALGIACDDLLLLARADLRWEQVQSVEAIEYDGYAYDLQVSEERHSGMLPHNFAADCLLTSNSMTTLHSNSPRDTLSRLETMVLMAGMELPLRAIREQISSALHLIVHQERMKDGTRRVTSISEVLRMEGDVISSQELFVFEQLGMENGRVVGRLRPTGIRPTFTDAFEMAGIHLSPTIFGYGESGWRN